MILLLFAWMGLAPPVAMGSHGDTHTPLGTVITFDSATVKFTWTLKSTAALFGDSRAVYTNKVYDTVTLLSSVDVTSNLETAFIGPRDSYTFVKHIRNLGNATDTYVVRGDSQNNFVTGLFVDASDGDSAIDAPDPPAGTIVVKDIKETVVLIRVQAPSTATDGRADTLLLSATSNAAVLPSAETVTLVVTLDSQPPTPPTLRTPANGLETSSVHPKFTWDTSVDTLAGLGYYRFEIDTSGLFTNPLITDTRTDTAFTPTDTLVRNRYYWRVRAIDTVGNISAANPDSFVLVIETGVTVTLVNPPAYQETRSATVRFEWTSPDADTFTWQLSKLATFALITDSAVDTTARSVTRTMPDQDTFYWRVIGRDTLANYDTATARVVVVDSTAGQVIGAAPADGHETGNAKVIVSWNALSDSVGIDSYAVEVSKSNVFTSTVFADTVDGAIRSDTVLGLFNDTYFWRVRAVDNLGNIGANSSTRGFLVDTTTGKVVLATPASGATTNDSTPTLTWTALADSVGIDSYVVEVSVRPAFDTLSFVDTVDGALTGDTSSPLADSTYYWRVRAIDNRGNAGLNSDSFVLVVSGTTTVTLVSPPAGHETTAAQVRFVWSSPTAETYTWQLSKSSTFIAITAVVADTGGTNVIQTIPDQDTFYWRVIGRDRNGVTDTTAGRMIVLDTSVDTVNVLSPAAGHETSNVKVVVSWSALADSVGIDSYVVEASKSGVFATSIFADTVDVIRTSDTITSLYNDTYYWRVRAIDDLGNAGAYSIVRGFVVDTAVSQVTLVAPINGHETSNSKPVVGWNAVTVDSVGIDSYVVEVSKSQLFTSLVFADTVGVSRTSDTLSGLYNDTYYWRVRAVDRLGNTGANSDSRGFLLDTQGPTVTLISPLTGIATNDSTPALSWQSTGILGILANRVTVSRVSTFTDSVYDTTVAGSRSSDTTKGLAEDTYYWRVIATNTIGNTVASSAFTFLVDVTPPTAPAPISPKYGHETSNLKPTFRWSTSIDTLSGLYAYRLEISRDSLFTALYRTDTYLVGGVGFSAATLETNSSSGELPVDTYYWRVIAIDNAGNTVGSIPPPFQIILISPTGSVTFDKTEYKGLRDIATIQLSDPLANLSPLVIDQADITVFSDADPTGFTVTLLETDVNTNLFTGTIQFTTGLSNSAMRKIRVNPGSGVSAKRVLTNGITVTGSTRWLTELGTTPTTDLTKTRSWPNPWNPTSGEPLIIQNLPADPSMTIEIYTTDMKKVRSLYNGSGVTASAFGNAAQWDGKNDAGQYVASGVYLYLVRSQFGTTVKKITLVK